MLTGRHDLLCDRDQGCGFRDDAEKDGQTARRDRNFGGAGDRACGTDDARACNLDATGGQLYYTVELSAAKPGTDPTIYWVKVSTADGSILDVTATQ